MTSNVAHTKSQYATDIQQLRKDVQAAIKDGTIKTQPGFEHLQNQLDILAGRYQQVDALGKQRYSLYFMQAYLHYAHGDFAKARQFLQVAENMYGGPFAESTALSTKLQAAATDDTTLFAKPKKQSKAAQLAPVSQGKRLANYCIDIAIYYVLVIALFIVIGVVSEITGSGLGLIDYETSDLLVGGYVLVYGLFFAYYAFFEAVFGKTPGKAITKTKVVNRSGGKISFWQAMGRTLCRFIPFEAFSYLPNNNPVGWHDKIPKTIVVSDIR